MSDEASTGTVDPTAETEGASEPATNEGAATTPSPGDKSPSLPAMVKPSAPGGGADGERAQADTGFELLLPRRALNRVRFDAWLEPRIEALSATAAAVLARRVVVLSGRLVPEDLIDAVAGRAFGEEARDRPCLQSAETSYGTMSEERLIEFVEHFATAEAGSPPLVLFDRRRLDPGTARAGALVAALADGRLARLLEERGLYFVLVHQGESDGGGDAVAALRRGAVDRGFDGLVIDVPWLPFWLDGHLQQDRIREDQADRLIEDAAVAIAANPLVDRRLAKRLLGTIDYDREDPESFITTFAADLAEAASPSAVRRESRSAELVERLANPIDAAVIVFAAFAPDLPEPIFRDLVEIALPDGIVDYDNLTEAQKRRYDRAQIDEVPAAARPAWHWREVWRDEADAARRRLAVVVRATAGGRRGVFLDSRHWNTEATCAALAERCPDIVRRTILRIIDGFMPRLDGESESPIAPNLTAQSQEAVDAVLRVAVAAGVAIELATADKIAEWLVLVARPVAHESGEFIQKYGRRLALGFYHVATELGRPSVSATAPSMKDVLGALLELMRNEENAAPVLASALVRLGGATIGEATLADDLLRRLLEQSDADVREALSRRSRGIIPFGVSAARRATLAPVLTRVAAPDDVLRRDVSSGAKAGAALALLECCLHPEMPYWGPHAYPLATGKAAFGVETFASVVFGEDRGVAARVVATLRDFDPIHWALSDIRALPRLQDVFWSSVAGPDPKLLERHETLGPRMWKGFVRHLLAPGFGDGIAASSSKDFFERFGDRNETILADAAEDLAAAPGDRMPPITADGRRAARAIVMPLRLFGPMLLAEWRFQRFGPANDGLDEADRTAIRAFLAMVADGAPARVLAVVDGWRRLARLASAHASACEVVGADAGRRVHLLKRDRYEAMAQTVERRLHAADPLSTSPKPE